MQRECVIIAGSLNKLIISYEVLSESCRLLLKCFTLLNESCLFEFSSNFGYKNFDTSIILTSSKELLVQCTPNDFARYYFQVSTKLNFLNIYIRDSVTQVEVSHEFYSSLTCACIY